MRIPRFISNNLVLKITSLNSVVVLVKLFISLFIQRFLAITLGEVGIAKIGNLRNVIDMLTSFSTFGTSDGIIKYVSEYKNDYVALEKLFSTTFVFTIIASFISMVALFFGAHYLAEQLFNNEAYIYVIKVVSFIVPFVVLHRVCASVVNGLMAYKVYAKSELIAYILSSIVLVLALYNYNINGVLVAIAITPLFYFIVLISIYGKVINDVVRFNALTFKVPFFKELLGFSAMSISAHVLFNYVEIDLRNLIAERLNEIEAGYWTAMTNLSKNYLVFASAVFTLYVLPKFSRLNTANDFKREVLHIYKTLLPLFAVGMLLLYVFRNAIIEFVYPNFFGMEPLFKWQLLADFVRLASMVLAFQFMAKKMVLAFIFTEIFSTFSFYFLASYLVYDFGTEGIVIANFIRYILYFVLVIILVIIYFKQLKNN